MKAKNNSETNIFLLLLGWILCIVFGFLLICNLTIIVKGTIDPERPPSMAGITPLVVLSGSMSGEEDGHIEVGDLILSQKVDAEELEEGDVISFMDGQSVVTHRIQGIKETDDGKLEFITKGDANNASDQKPVSQDQLVGRFILRIPKVGDFAMFLQTPLGMAIFIGVPLLAFLVYDMIRR